MKTCSNGVPFARRPCVCQSGPRLMAIYGPPKGGGGQDGSKKLSLAGDFAADSELARKQASRRRVARRSLDLDNYIHSRSMILSQYSLLDLSMLHWS